VRRTEIRRGRQWPDPSAPRTPIARNAWLNSARPVSGSGLKVVRVDAASVADMPKQARKRTRDSRPTPGVRAMVLKRDGRMCVCCGQSIEGRRYSLAHRLRASQGGKAVPSNLITMLGWGGQEHHGRIDNRQDPEDEARGFTVRSGTDPAYVPVMVFSEGGSGVLMYATDGGEWTEIPPWERFTELVATAGEEGAA
jgi:hypothetical protein